LVDSLRAFHTVLPLVALEFLLPSFLSHQILMRKMLACTSQKGLSLTQPPLGLPVYSLGRSVPGTTSLPQTRVAMGFLKPKRHHLQLERRMMTTRHIT
jgi:hypothetical protein